MAESLKAHKDKKESMTMHRYTDRVVLITGSGSGIGRNLAERFAAEGATVAVADINGDAARETAKAITDLGHRVQAFTVDVADTVSVHGLIEEVESALGGIDVLINNAASTLDLPFLDLSEREWDLDVGVTLKGPFLCSQAVLPGMLQREGGVILNIGSVNGFSYFGNDLYSAAKAGLLSLTRALAVRYGRSGVRVNLIAPGTIRTPFWDGRLAKDPAVHQRLARWYPLGRIGEPDDVADAALFLASSAASWITGTALTVDGGLLAGNAVMTADILGEDY
ncbi:SDR family NAD(P)-dependent oxidoreductase [Nonomuraea sp. H19]|uniref:SDR family NAD(P)-dependent oxidoreductase n=1 Tax=Nonomuraea sp. H19 TaxID=3452206 RepID=UPI003F8B4919